MQETVLNLNFDASDFAKFDHAGHEIAIKQRSLAGNPHFFPFNPCLFNPDVQTPAHAQSSVSEVYGRNARAAPYVPGAAAPAPHIRLLRSNGKFLCRPHRQA
jgi:hypothetical protein